MTGVWVIAHECGHQSFSKYGFVNDTVGWIFHSLLLVPYFSWKFTHAQHHSGTSDMSRDTVFVPPSRKEVEENKFEPFLHDAPLYTLTGVAFMLLLGWPAYLWANFSGQKYLEWGSHFHPSSPCFQPHQRKFVLLSDIGLALTCTLFAYWIYHTSFVTFLSYYFAPYLWVNLWLVTITFLQHTHPAVAHYRGKEWNFVRGALATVDRDYGFILNTVFHHINDTHVCHHLFSLVPHYHAQEVTEILKQKLGSDYLYDSTPVFKAVWQTWDQCRCVSNEGDILYWEDLSEKKRN